MQFKSSIKFILADFYNQNEALYDFLPHGALGLPAVFERPEKSPCL